ncbi:hypothetical protein [Chitinophaga sp. Cy-1792]|uniref:hypothetical protein n=1 Tax=Chitinophaga sp. Cy-1792 TaxID=2608339 RepID=UPI00142284B7|nr:hypothetical protein [Chitinophaga sp. Cy-1792]NIG52755.1 hypothetical protein [Chitinophaga sp. Cy-1792]
MERKFHINKGLKVLLLVLSVLIVAVLALGIYLNIRWNKTIRNELKSYVRDISDSLYVAEFKDARLNVFTGSLTVEQASMRLDSAVYQRMLAKHIAPSATYQFKVEKLQLKYFRPWRYFQRKVLSASELTVTAPDVILEENENVVDTSKEETAYEHISTKMKSILISTLQLDSTNIKYTFIRKDSSRIIHQFRNLGILVNDFLIDSLALEDPGRILYARNYVVKMRDYRFMSKDSLYWMNIRNISYDAAAQIFNIGQFDMTPALSKEEFQQKIGFQQDYYQLSFSDISTEHLSITRLLQDQQIWADKIVIHGGNIDIYRDRRPPMPPGDKLGQFPNQQLARVPIPLFIDTLEGRRVHIQYTETSPLTNETGTIRFSNINGIFRNITNIDSMVARNDQLTADLDAIFMGSGKLKAHFDFTLGSKTGNFGVSGELSNMNGKDLNAVTKPLGKLEIRSCDLKELTFQLRGDERKAGGNLKLLYSNLRIAILEQDKTSKGFVRKGLISMVANILALHPANPAIGEPVRTAKPQLQRDIQKSFFNLVWKTILEGVKETVGTGKI